MPENKKAPASKTKRATSSRKAQPKAQNEKVKAPTKGTEGPIEPSGQSPEQPTEQKVIEAFRSALPEMKVDLHCDLATNRPFTVFDMYKPAKEYLDAMMREGRKWKVSVNTVGDKKEIKAPVSELLDWIFVDCLKARDFSKVKKLMTLADKDPDTDQDIAKLNYMLMLSDPLKYLDKKLLARLKSAAEKGHMESRDTLISCWLYLEKPLSKKKKETIEAWLGEFSDSGFDISHTLWNNLEWAHSTGKLTREDKIPWVRFLSYRMNDGSEWGLDPFLIEGFKLTYLSASKKSLEKLKKDLAKRLYGHLVGELKVGKGTGRMIKLSKIARVFVVSRPDHVSLSFTGPQGYLGVGKFKLAPDSNGSIEVAEIINHINGIIDVDPEFFEDELKHFRLFSKTK